MVGLCRLDDGDVALVERSSLCRKCPLELRGDGHASGSASDDEKLVRGGRGVPGERAGERSGAGEGTRSRQRQHDGHDLLGLCTHRHSARERTELAAPSPWEAEGQRIGSLEFSAEIQVPGVYSRLGAYRTPRRAGARTRVVTTCLA